MMIYKDGKLDLKTLRQGLVAFNLMERYLQHFEDNLRERFNQAARQISDENNQVLQNGLNQATSLLNKKNTQKR